MEYERLLPHIDRLELWVGNAVMTQEEIGALRATGAAVSVFSAQKFRRSLNAQLRTIIKTCGHFPTDDAAIKLLWLAQKHRRQMGIGHTPLDQGHTTVRRPLRGTFYPAPYRLAAGRLAKMQRQSNCLELKNSDTPEA